MEELDLKWKSWIEMEELDLNIHQQKLRWQAGNSGLLCLFKVVVYRFYHAKSPFGRFFVPSIEQANLRFSLLKNAKKNGGNLSCFFSGLPAALALALAEVPGIAACPAVTCEDACGLSDSSSQYQDPTNEPFPRSSVVEWDGML